MTSSVQCSHVNMVRIIQLNLKTSSMNIGRGIKKFNIILKVKNRIFIANATKFYKFLKLQENTRVVFERNLPNLHISITCDRTEKNALSL